LIVPYADVPLPDQQVAQSQIRRFALPVREASVDPRNGIVYFSMPSDAIGMGNTVLPFNPIDGTFANPVWVGSEPYFSTVTPDGRYLYLLLYGSRTVQRLQLPSLKQDLEFPILNNNGEYVQATALLNVPNAPSTTIAVERSLTGVLTQAEGVAI